MLVFTIHDIPRIVTDIFGSQAKLSPQLDIQKLFSVSLADKKNKEKTVLCRVLVCHTELTQLCCLTISLDFSNIDHSLVTSISFYWNILNHQQNKTFSSICNSLCRNISVNNYFSVDNICILGLNASCLPFPDPLAGLKNPIQFLS